MQFGRCYEEFEVGAQESRGERAMTGTGQNVHSRPLRCA